MDSSFSQSFGQKNAPKLTIPLRVSDCMQTTVNSTCEGSQLSPFSLQLEATYPMGNFQAIGLWCSLNDTSEPLDGSHHGGKWQ